MYLEVKVVLKLRMIVSLGPVPMITINLKLKDCLNFKIEKFTVRKAIFKSYLESQFLLDPDVHAIIIRKNYQTDFVCKLLITHDVFDLS